MKTCRYFRSSLTIVAAATLSGCTTFSFAPPSVQTDYKLAPSQSVCGHSSTTGSQIYKDFRGARDLIDNFTTAYRCASREAADGRQIFEVPSFLALVAAAIGPTFGLTDDGRLAAAAAAAVYGRANSYYAPREKIPALDAALDAVLCVKSESIGVAFFDTRAGDAERARAAVISAQGQISQLRGVLATLETRRAAAVVELQKLSQVNDNSSATRKAVLDELTSLDASIGTTRAELATLEAALNALVDPKAVGAAALTGMGIDGVSDQALVVSLNEQYFEMVSSALLSIERILANRLKSAGKYDPAGLQAEIGKLIEAEGKSKPPVKLAGMPDADKNEAVKLMVAAIQPKLQSCVVRAKLG